MITLSKVGKKKIDPIVSNESAKKKEQLTPLLKPVVSMIENMSDKAKKAEPIR